MLVLQQVPSAPGFPDRVRLEGIVSRLVEDLDPQQIILFGSGARGRMTADSDIDLLVIRQPAPGENEYRPYTCRSAAGGDEDGVHVLLMSRRYAEDGRLVAADVRQEALEDGRTLYARPGIPELPTGQPFTLKGAMVKSSLYTPDESLNLLAQAERKMATADLSPHPVDKCEYLQASMERCLKALVAARGRRTIHVHKLAPLWDAVEATGETIPVSRNDTLFHDLSRYAGDLSYKPPPDRDAQQTWDQAVAIGRPLLEYARTRVPELAEQTRAHNKTVATAADSTRIA